MVVDQYWYMSRPFPRYLWWLTGLIVDNDFHRSGAIFRLFDNLEVKNIDETLEVADYMKGLTINGDAKVNGETNGVVTNGKINGVHANGETNGVIAN